jgi:hypothetical protein
MALPPSIKAPQTIRTERRQNDCIYVSSLLLLVLQAFGNKTPRGADAVHLLA